MLTIVDVWSPRCMPCYMIAPILEELENEYEDVEFLKLNIDENPDFGQKYFVFGIPTLLFLKDGEEVDRIIGVVPKDFIKAKINKWID